MVFRYFGDYFTIIEVYNMIFFRWRQGADGAAPATAAATGHGHGTPRTARVRSPATGPTGVRTAATGSADVRAAASGSASVRSAATGSARVRSAAAGSTDVRPAAAGPTGIRSAAAGPMTSGCLPAAAGVPLIGYAMGQLVLLYRISYTKFYGSNFICFHRRQN